MQSSESGLFSQPGRMAGIFGIAFLILFLAMVIGVQGELPLLDDSAEDIRAYYVDNHDSYLIGDFLIGVAFIFLFIPFAACFRSILAAAEGGTAIGSRLFYTGAILTVVLGGISSVGSGALALMAGQRDVSDDAIVSLHYMSAYGFSAIGLGFGLTALSASLVIISSAVLPKWLGYLGAAAAVCASLGGLWVVSGDDEGLFGLVGVIGYLGFAIWLLAVSVTLLMRSKAPAVAPATA